MFLQNVSHDAKLWAGATAWRLQAISLTNANLSYVR